MKILQWLIVIVIQLTHFYMSIYSCEQLGDFPPPDFTKFVRITNKGYESFVEVDHNFGTLPFHVRVYSLAKDGNNAGFVFEGGGACQNDGIKSGNFGGLLFAYNKKSIRVWAPINNGRVIFVGNGWGNDQNSQSTGEADVKIEAWKSGPSPAFEKEIQIHSILKPEIFVEYSLLQVPELVSIRVSPTRRKEGDFVFHGTGASQTPNSTRSYGGVIYAYNDKKLLLWTPNQSKTGCIVVGKRWGNGKYIQTVQNCTINVRLWINSFPPPLYQTNWQTFSANQPSQSFFEFKHNLRILPTYVRVQYRFPDQVHPLIFEGSGSVQSPHGNTNRFGGVVFAYSTMAVRVWLPVSDRPGQASIIYVGNGWGRKNESARSLNAEIRIQLYVNRCFNKGEIVDSQGYCRHINETSLTQQMTAWGRCSNACGPGHKFRKVADCTGKGLKTIINCHFQNGLCGFEPSIFPWTITTAARIKKVSHTLQIPAQGPKKYSYFIYANTTNKKPGDQGVLASMDLDQEEGCILKFKYAAQSYFGELRIDVITANGKLEEDIWHMTDAQLMKSVWQTGYVNIGKEIGPIRKFLFVQQLKHPDPDTDEKYLCPDACHPLSLTDISLECARKDSHIISEEVCEEKKITLSSCLIDVFQPYFRGPAWAVRTQYSYDKKEVGKFVTAIGKPGNLIATYEFRVKKKGRYLLWIDSFALSNTTNAITIEISGEKYTRDLIYTRQNSIWLPFSVTFSLKAGSYFLNLTQAEESFHFKNLMIAPVSIDVWRELGMQSRFIPDSSFQSIAGKSKKFVFSRLNGLGAWMPTDQNKGRFYLEIHLPEVALINKIATQGGQKFDHSETVWYCYTEEYKIKFSLDGRSFAYYRNNTLKDVYLFRGNSARKDEIVEHTLAYALVAKAVRFYPLTFQTSGCLRIELYGYYLFQNMCPRLNVKLKQSNCSGNGICPFPNEQCGNNEETNTKECRCVKNYHGEKCQLFGCNPNPCQNNATCISGESSFTCICKPGHKGQFCQIPCSKGFYGVSCEKRCNCPLMEYCDPKTGRCSCLPGFYGSHCNIQCKNLTYGRGCKEICSCKEYMICDPTDGTCQCPPGFTGERCDVKCTNGTYGKDCSKKCSCLNGGICNVKTGDCDCPAGWIGLTCHYACPPNRYGKGCAELCQNPKHSRCDPVTGHTICDPGLFGDHCEHSCPENRYGKNCAFTCSCSENTNICNIKTGFCMCKPGYTGNRCESECKGSWGQMCKNQCTCQNGGTCDVVTGKCTCLHGFTGDECEIPCKYGFYGKDCKKVCDCTDGNTDACDKAAGTCNCKPGYHGPTCDKKCPEDRWGRDCSQSCECQNNGECDFRDGFCYCPDGFKGASCEKECNEHWFGRGCLNKCKCQNGADCDSKDGYCRCTDGYKGIECEQKCENGTYGLHCVKKCQCLAKRTHDCNHVNGSCTCLPGYQGNLCEEECADGYYGRKCQSKCLCYHSKSPCAKIDGQCRCTAGFIGRTCADDCDWSHYGDSCGKECHCSHGFLCNNINGQCFDADAYTFRIDLLVSWNAFAGADARRKLNENFENLMFNCFEKYISLQKKYPERNVSSFGHCDLATRSPVERFNPDMFVSRVVRIQNTYSQDDQDVSSVTLNLLYNGGPVNGSLVNDVLMFVGHVNVSAVLKRKYYIGVLGSPRRGSSWYHGTMKYVVNSVAVVGGLILIILIVLIVRYTNRAKNPSLFQKIKRESKEIEMPMLPNGNSHMLAFENPYYDVIAAMGLDDDIEEDYYNPLYDDLELHSDSDGDVDDMYYHRYGQELYLCEKDSGFSSGTLI